MSIPATTFILRTFYLNIYCCGAWTKCSIKINCDKNTILFRLILKRRQNKNTVRKSVCYIHIHVSIFWRAHGYTRTYSTRHTTVMHLNTYSFHSGHDGGLVLRNGIVSKIGLRAGTTSECSDCDYKQLIIANLTEQIWVTTDCSFA